MCVGNSSLLSWVIHHSSLPFHSDVSVFDIWTMRYRSKYVSYQSGVNEMVSVSWRTKSWSLRMSKPLAHWVEHHTYYCSQVSRHRFHRRSRKPLWGRVAETEEPECTWKWGVWAWGGCGCVCYSATVRYTITIWSRKSRHKTSGGLSSQNLKKKAGRRR